MKQIHSNQSGIAHLVAIMVIVVLGIVGLVGWQVLSKDNSSKVSSPSSANPSEESESDIALQNVGLESIGDVAINQYAVREYASQGLKGFYVFGDKLSGGRSNPNFEFSSLEEGTKVVSAIDGIVAHITEQTETKDSEVFIQPKDGSVWTIGYDHIVNLAVKKGDTVKAGDVIGEPAVQNNGLTRFEIQINKDEDGQTTHYCPSTLLATSVKEKLLAELGAMQTEWETETGLELYDLTTQDPVGCIKKTMTPSDAEGR